MPTTQTTAERVGANVRAELARRNITQTDLANHLGLGVASMSGRINGRIPIDVNELAAIAAYLETPTTTLLA